MEAFLRRWFVKRHGEGEAHQADVYRCNICGHLRTWNQIRKPDLCCQGRVIPTTPTLWEAVKLFVAPWLF